MEIAVKIGVCERWLGLYIKFTRSLLAEFPSGRLTGHQSYSRYMLSLFYVFCECSWPKSNSHHRDSLPKWLARILFVAVGCDKGSFGLICLEDIFYFFKLLFDAVCNLFISPPLFDFTPESLKAPGIYVQFNTESYKKKSSQAKLCFPYLSTLKLLGISKKTNIRIPICMLQESRYDTRVHGLIHSPHCHPQFAHISFKTYISTSHNGLLYSFLTRPAAPEFYMLSLCGFPFFHIFLDCHW